MRDALARRAVLAVALTAGCSRLPLPASASTELQLGLSRTGVLRACPSSASPIASGCVSSSPSAAPNQYLAPWRYEGEKDFAFRKLKTELALPSSGFRLLEGDSPEYVHAVCEDGELELRFLAPEDGFGFVTFRLISGQPTVMPAFCGTRGCINGNNAQRARVESLKNQLGWRSADASFENEKYSGWVPIFLH
jgi:hypothetical protein